MNAAKLILFALIGVFIAQIGFYYPNLPETVASHFDGTGKPDGFMNKQFFVVFEIALLLIIVGESLLLPRLIEKMPDSWINLPNKSFWLAPERRAQTFARFRESFEWFSVLLLTFFIVVNQMVFRANIRQENLPSLAFWGLIGVFLVAVLIWLIKFVRTFTRKPE